jgi:hypothetical protein
MIRTLLALATLLLLTGCDESPAAAPDPGPTTTTVSAPPASYDDLPEGPSTDLPWWHAGVLHVDGGTVATPLRLLVHRGGTTLAGRSSVARGAEWELVRDGELVPLVAAAGPLVPRISPDGGLAAWVEVDGDRQQVTAYDVAAGTVLGTWTTTQEVACCDGTGAVSVVGIDVTWRILLGGVGRGSAVWTPGREPVRVWRVEPFQDQWPLGVSWQAPGSGPLDSVSAFGTLDEAGRVERVGAIADDQTGLWSADGAGYAHPGTATGEAPVKAVLDHWWVTGTDGPDSTEVELLVPTDELLELVAWESPTAVVLQARRPYGDPDVDRPGFVGLLRCDTTTGACERVADGPPRGSRLPDRNF